METKIPNENLNSNKKNNNPKKVKLDMGSGNSIILKAQEFYMKHLKTLHVIIFAIMIILYVVSFYLTYNSVKNGKVELADGLVAQGFSEMLKENLFLDLVIIVAGIVPYFYIPIIGVAQAMVVVNELITRYVAGASHSIPLFIGGALEMIGISVCVAIGLYYCKLTSKKNKYYHQSNFGINDIKMQMAEIRKDKDKIEEIKKKKEEKDRKIQECNIKIPYLNFAILAAVAFCVQFVGLIITLI